MPLHPLPKKAEEPAIVGDDNPTVYCEACGTQGKTHTMYGFLISMGVAGHPLLPGFSCGASQGEKAHNHWSCAKLDCFQAVLCACASEHLHHYIEKAKEQFNGNNGHEV